MIFLFSYTAWECWWLAPLAFLMDILLGDPPLPWPHPVVFIGKLLRLLEKPARFLEQRGWGRAAGLGSVLFLACCTGLTVGALVELPFIGPVFAIYFSWAGLALGCLLQTGKHVAGQIENSPLSTARQALSMLVSRDVSSLDRPLLAKTLADTLSENFTDAFLAPYFWLFVAGPVGLWCYKAVSTTDSMWGYTVDRWRLLGWAGARGDDVLAFVPARLSVFVLWLTDRLCRFFSFSRPWQGSWPGLRTILLQARGMPSPNSGLPMAACAWLCAGHMAGPSVYFGTVVDKPWLGPQKAVDCRDWDSQRLDSLCGLLRRASFVAVGLFFAIHFFKL